MIQFSEALNKYILSTPRQSSRGKMAESTTFPQFKNIGKLKLTRNASEKKTINLRYFCYFDSTTGQKNICQAKTRAWKRGKN
jgi:hypothetical protein